MKRCAAGAVLLAALILLGAASSLWTKTNLEPLEIALEQAAEASFQENWAEKTALTESVRAEWERCRRISGILFSQQTVEEIDSLFGRLRLWQQARDGTAWALDCLVLSSRFRAMQDSQTLQLLHLL